MLNTSARLTLHGAGVAALAAVAVGCTDDIGLEVSEPLDIPEGCNPLAADLDCLLPYPSDVFLVEDDSLPSGRRVEHGAARLRHDGGVDVDPTLRHPADGFSFMPQLLALFGAPIDDGDLPSATSPERSLEDDSPTAVVEAASGERVLHLAELDPRADEPSQQALNIRPLVRLHGETRYVVGIRDLKGPDGEPIAVPEGFRRIRDGEVRGDPILEPLAERYEREVFPVLEEAGFSRGELVLAWDFTTQSQEHVAGDMLAVRDAVIAALEETPPPVTITAVDDDPDDPHIYRRVRGHLEVPLFLEEDKPMAAIARGSDGRPVANGTTDAEFTILVPHSVFEAAEPARFLQYGHGFFGSRGEIEGSFVTGFAERTGMVVGAVDWIGSASSDRLPVGAALVATPSEALGFTDRLHQAMAHQIALSYALRSTLLEEDALQRDDGSALVSDAAYFYGISQGHILGGTFVALSPHIERAVLSVGGASYALMMMRARPFIQFLDLLETLFENPLDLQKFVSLTATTFDRIDPITYAPYVLADPLPGAPSERRVLMHVGIGDASVANIASHAHARALGLSHLAPAPREVAGLAQVEAPYDGSAMVEFDFGLPEPVPGTYAEPAAEDNEVHEGVRRLDPAILQVDAFLAPDGAIEHFCDGACTPE